jgi:hypothetical protein
MKCSVWLALLFASLVQAQSVPNGGITPGQVWTTPQWVNAWQAKADTANPNFIGTVQLNGVSLPSYPQTAAEIAAAATPVNFTYPAGAAQRYGAVGDCVADDTTALQNDINASQIAGIPVVLAAGACYYTATGLTFKQGQSSTDTQKYKVNLVGNNATIKPAASQTAITITPRCLLADIGTGRGVAPINISDLIIDGGAAGGTGAYAIFIGAAGYRWDSFAWSKITNVTVQNFSATLNPVVHLIEGRHAAFDRFILRSGATLYIDAVTTGSFVGDFVFTASEFNGSSTQRPIVIQTGAGSTNGQARGIKFIASDIYGGGTYLNTAAAGAQVGDIWFNSVQFDSAAGTDTFLEILSTGTGSIFGVHVVGDYFVTGTQAVYVHTGSGGTTQQIDISGNQIGPLSVLTSTGTAAISCISANGVSVNGNQFSQITGGTNTNFINFNACTQLAAVGNNANNDTSVTQGISVGNASNHWSFVSNTLDATTNINHYTLSGSPVYEEIDGTSGTLSFNGTTIPTVASSQTVTGNWTMTPASGVPLQITAPAGSQAMLLTGAANSPTLGITSSTTTGQAKGLVIHAGSNTSDSAIFVNNAAQTTSLLNLEGDGSLVVGSPTGGAKGVGTVNAAGVYSNGTQLLPTLTGTTGSIGGGALTVGTCTSGTAAVTNSTTAMAVAASPVTYPGDGIYWVAYVSAAGTVTVKVCATASLTPAASAYNVRILQ